MDDKRNPAGDRPGPVDRPGFDLGGSRDKDPGGVRNTTPTGPLGTTATGNTGTGRAQGLADAGRTPSGSGNPGSGSGSGPTDGSGGPK